MEDEIHPEMGISYAEVCQLTGVSVPRGNNPSTGRPWTPKEALEDSHRRVREATRLQPAEQVQSPAEQVQPPAVQVQPPAEQIQPPIPNPPAQQVLPGPPHEPPLPPAGGGGGGGGSFDPSKSTFGMPPVPPDSLCYNCFSAPATIQQCDCPHYACADCYLINLRTALPLTHINCTTKDSLQMGDMARGIQSGYFLEFGMQILRARGRAELTEPAVPPSEEEEKTFTALSALNSQRLEGVLSQVCPQFKTCGGMWVAPGDDGSRQPAPGQRPIGQRVQCQQGRRPGSTLRTPCPCEFCVFCGEVWDPRHEGMPCGAWRPPPPPPPGVKYCPNCNTPHIHRYGHGCHHIPGSGTCPGVLNGRPCGIKFCWVCEVPINASGDCPNKDRGCYQFCRDQPQQTSLGTVPPCGCLPCEICNAATGRRCPWHF